MELRNITLKIDGKLILDDITCSIKQGDFLAILGHNGAGKSTLIKIIAGIIKPTSGKIIGATNIGYVAQRSINFDSAFPLTVEDVVNQGLIGTTKNKDAVKNALTTVGMQDQINQHIGQLSGGQAQRVFIARALVSNPEILILDEPTTGVDVQSQEEFFATLQSLHEKGMTILFVTHDISSISSHITKVMCLQQHLQFFGTVAQFKKMEASDKGQVTLHHDHCCHQC